MFNGAYLHCKSARIYFRKTEVSLVSNGMTGIVAFILKTTVSGAHFPRSEAPELLGGDLSTHRNKPKPSRMSRE